MFLSGKDLGLMFVLLLSVSPANFRGIRNPEPSSTTMPPSLSWTTEDWSSDSKPYHALRYRLFAASNDAASATAAAGAYRLQARQTPHDSRAVFAYVYATYHANQLSPKFGGHGELVEAEQALEFVVPTHTYEYARLHFLVTASNHPRHALKNVAERLLRHTPDDILVEWQLGSVLRPGEFPQERKEALWLAHDLIRRSPNNPDFYADLAGTYYHIWEASENPADGKKAVATYRVYLARAPKDAPFRKRAQSIIDGMPTIQAYWDKKAGRH